MTIRLFTAALLFSASLVTQASAAPVAHAGDWETKIDDGPTHHICMGKDHTFDQSAMQKTMSLTSAKCTPGTWSQMGNTVTYETTCDIAGGKLTSRSVMTMTGSDSYTTRSTSHMVGGSVKMPDMDMTQTARRDGPCTPGEKVSPY